MDMTRYGIEGFEDDELDYYSRQIVLQDIGLTGQRKLKEARVCLVGLGGLGSPIAIQLASMGVGHLRIVDRDVVETSNLQRQHLYDMDMVGYPKVEAAAMRLSKQNPYIEIEAIPTSLTSFNAEKIVAGMDVVVDGLDRMAPRYALNRACVKHGIPFVFGAAITHVGNTSTIIPGETACLECFLGDIDDEEMPTCSTVGVHPAIINIIASIQVSETVKILTGKTPNLKDTLLYCDLSDLSFEKVHIAKVDGCPVCGSDATSEPPTSTHEPLKEICGRDGRRVFVFTPREDLNLNLDLLNEHLVSLGFDINVGAKLGTTFSGEPGIKASVLKSGVTILEGVDSRDEAVKLHSLLAVEKTGRDTGK
jgi:adenylyltransferase/sulfurtransferase